MKQNFIFVFVLLATLSTVSAVPYLRKRVTKFGLCDLQRFQPQLPSPSATISPDPIIPGETGNINITITTKLNSDVAADSGDSLRARFVAADGSTINGYDAFVELCTAKGIKCPIPAGTEFTTTLEKVSVPDKPSLGEGASIRVFVGTADFGYLACSQSEPIT